MKGVGMQRAPGDRLEDEQEEAGRREPSQRGQEGPTGRVAGGGGEQDSPLLSWASGACCVDLSRELR